MGINPSNDLKIENLNQPKTKTLEIQNQQVLLGKSKVVRNGRLARIFVFTTLGGFSVIATVLAVPPLLTRRDTTIMSQRRIS